jgi:hypothetical protein
MAQNYKEYLEEWFKKTLKVSLIADPKKNILCIQWYVKFDSIEELKQFVNQFTSYYSPLFRVEA